METDGSFWTSILAKAETARSRMVFQGALSRHFKSITSSAPFTKYLLVTNVLMGGSIDLCGDNIAQRIIEKSKSTDWSRSGRIVAVSVSLCIPAHYWYQRLDKWFPLKTRRHIAKKIILDLFAAGPFFISGFYLAEGVSGRGRGMSGGGKHVRKGSHLKPQTNPLSL